MNEEVKNRMRGKTSLPFQMLKEKICDNQLWQHNEPETLIGTEYLDERKLQCITEKSQVKHKSSTHMKKEKSEELE